jgi:hypothetical protein
VIPILQILRKIELVDGVCPCCDAADDHTQGCELASYIRLAQQGQLPESYKRHCELTFAKVVLARNVRHLLEAHPSQTIGLSSHSPKPEAKAAFELGYRAAVEDMLKHLQQMPSQPEYLAMLHSYVGRASEPAND